MTLYGKILVLMNFGLSVTVMICAMMLYFMRIDWTEGPQKPEELWGQLRKRNENVKVMWDGIGVAEVRWREVHADVQEEEGFRAADRPWYLTELEHDRNSATEMNPARTVAYDKGLLVLEPVANEPKHLRPKMVDATYQWGLEDGKPKDKKLASLKSYQAGEEKARNELIATVNKLTTLFDENKAMTNRLTPEEGKGLRDRIKDEIVKVKRLDEELALVQTLRVNAGVDNEQIGRSDKMLVKRIEELKKWLGIPEKQP